MKLKIIEVPVPKIQDGAIVQIPHFVVVSGEGEERKPFNNKMYEKFEDAKMLVASMGTLVEGLEFAAACYPGLSEKAHRGKANVVSEFLQWIKDGKPVKEIKEDAPVAEDAPVDPAEDAPVDEEEQF